MKKIIWMVVLLAVAGYAVAQDIRITRFERNYTSLRASMNPVYDNTGTPCALIRFAVRDTSMVIEPNNGYVRRETKNGEICLYVPTSTKRLTLRAYGLKPLRDYELPVRLESKVTYDAEIETATIIDIHKEPEPFVEPQRREKVKPQSMQNNNVHLYLGVGWNILPLNGPEVSFGVDINHHLIELSGVYGLKKTDPMFFYTTNDENPRAAWQYAGIRGSLSYGYDLLKESPVGVVPMIGVTGSYYRGINYMGIMTGEYKKSSSFSAFAVLRLRWSPMKHLRIQVNPRYDVNLFRSNTCKKISDYDGRLRGWTKGFSFSAGLAWVI